jgi:hypothetical protein
MRKNICYTFAFIFLFFLSCTSTNYYKTGNELPPLSQNEEVTVFSNSKPDQKYDIIGMVRIRGGRENVRIEKAKVYAKEKGGNGIIAREIGLITEPGTENVIEKIGTSTYETQEFLIVKFEGKASAAKVEKLEEAKDIVSENKVGTSEPSPSNVPTLDYSTIPRATYKQLVKNYKALNGKLFRASAYPKKIFKIPSSFKLEPGTGDRLVLLTTKNGTNNLYLIINKNNIPMLKSKIYSNKMIDFVYTPVQTYTSKAGKHPVIKLVEEITAVK